MKSGSLFIAVVIGIVSVGYAGYEMISPSGNDAPLQTNGLSYTGSLSYNVALNATGAWTDNPLTISWIVSQNGNGSWHYKYTYTTGSPNIHDVLIETSTSFNSGSISNVVYGSYTQNTSYSIDTFTVSDDPARLTNLPEDIYGIRFTIQPSSATTFIVDFDSDYAPEWGDFYANCGHAKGDLNSAWNISFTSSDIDPTNPAQSGTIDNSLLVPSPEPATIALLGLGFMCIRKRK
ncbi:MAG: PEP-CTERM sorting domain-containing protein [Sedimentisphaeraceae bacterium JB056]